MHDPLRTVLIGRHMKTFSSKVKKNPQKPRLAQGNMIRLLGGGPKMKKI